MILGTIGSLAYAANKMNKAISNDEKALEKNIKAFEQAALANKDIQVQEVSTDKSINRLIKRKSGIILTTIQDFINIYEKIGEIDKVGAGKGIKELYSLQNIHEDIHNMKELTKQLLPGLNTRDKITCFGLNLFIGDGIMGAPLGLINGFVGVIERESELNLQQANIRKKESGLLSTQAETICLSLQAISERADRIYELICKINTMLRKSNDNIARLISNKGVNINTYSENEIREIEVCCRTAIMLIKVLNVPVIDYEGNITEQSSKAIELGEMYLKEASNLISM